MPITLQDIVFVESQSMDDVSEGGGALTGVVIQDGQMNNVFEDISDLDRALGRFNLRKVGIAVRSADTDLYGGVKTVITQRAADPDVNYTLFQTGDPFDRRAAAVNRVEAYLYKGPMWPGYLYENHIVGMRAIGVIQRVGTALPPIGKTLTLVQNEGLGNELEQYVRVIGVDTTEATLTDGDGDFVRWIVSLKLSDALRFNFNGHTPSRFDADYTYTNKTRLRDTTVADATRYYGSQPVAAAGALGAFQIRAASIFTQLVPTARAETPLANQVMNPTLVQSLSAGARTVEVPQQAHTRALEVTAENRRLNWIETLLPRPAPNTLSVSYRAQGNWYVLSDDGAGLLSGSDPAFGSGTVDYGTGVTPATLGALPDAGSQILYAWASPVHYTARFGTNAANEATVGFLTTLEFGPILAGTLTLAWTAGGVARTATADATGAIAGHATGTLDPISRALELVFTVLPDRGTFLTLDYDWYEPSEPGALAVIEETALATASIALNQAPLADTLRFWLNVTRGWVLVVESGGALIVPAQRVRDAPNGSLVRYWVVASPQTIGSRAGTVLTLTATAVSVIAAYWSFSTWTTPAGDHPINIGSTIHATYRPDVAGSAVAAQDTPALSALRFRLLPTLTDSAVPGSVRFTVGGLTYDDANGDLLTGVNFHSGSVAYDSGDCTLTYWTDGASVNASVASLLTRFGDWTATEASFRALLAPLIPESLAVLAVAEDGETLTGNADADGVITGPVMRGSVNYEFGTARVEFGTLAGDVWTPRAVDPSTIRYNAVAYSYIPLDAEILGVDAVRLPPDGRVPIFRKGDVVMIMHPAETTGTPAQDGGTGPYLLSCGRPRLAWVRVTDANGDTVDSGFTLDRATGVLSWASLAGLATPLTVRHTVGDLRLVTDVQIDGTLTLARPLSHAFPADEALVGSCLLHGDRRARVSATWFQTSWDGTWLDYAVGAAPVWALDTISHPIRVTNEGAITERWILRWTTTTNVQIVGETRGLVYNGPFTGDLAPINPFTRNPDGSGGVPYFTIPLAANGGGQSTGNAARINTVGALIPLWIARAVGQSDEPLDDGADGCELYALGNIDRP